MNFYFPQHALLPHVILRRAGGEVAESIRKTPEMIWILQLRASPPCRMTWLSAAAGWWSVGMNRMTQPSTFLRVTFSSERGFPISFWKSGFCNFVQNDMRMKVENWINGFCNSMQNAHAGEVRYWKKNPVQSPWGEGNKSLIESMFTETLDRLYMQNDI